MGLYPFVLIYNGDAIIKECLGEISCLRRELEKVSVLLSKSKCTLGKKYAYLLMVIADGIFYFTL